LLFLCWMLTFYAIIGASLGFDSAHYYAPLVAANAICSGVAVGLGLWAAGRALMGSGWMGRWLGARAGQNTQMPAT
jgi:hypothetical protein